MTKQELCEQLSNLQESLRELEHSAKCTKKDIAKVRMEMLKLHFADVKEGDVFTLHRARWGATTCVFEGLDIQEHRYEVYYPVVRGRVFKDRVQGDAVEGGVMTGKGRPVVIPFYEAIKLKVGK